MKKKLTLACLAVFLCLIVMGIGSIKGIDMGSSGSVAIAATSGGSGSNLVAVATLASETEMVMRVAGTAILPANVGSREVKPDLLHEGSALNQRPGDANLISHALAENTSAIKGTFSASSPVTILGSTFVS